ncbi:MAG: CBS domain-containing protein [Gammaproteobacteria bacterium]
MNAQVQDWMTAQVISVPPSASIDEADGIMRKKGIRRLAVKRGDELAGIISQGDVRAAKATAAADRGEFARVPSVGMIMTPNPVTIPASASVALAAHTMLQMKVSGLPVVDEHGELCGILSDSDLFRYIVAAARAA